ncbi:hypothetical protein QOT17_003979 [Balamuthia mandrillaris]
MIKGVVSSHATGLDMFSLSKLFGAVVRESGSSSDIAAREELAPMARGRKSRFVLSAAIMVFVFFANPLLRSFRGEKLKAEQGSFLLVGILLRLLSESGYWNATVGVSVSSGSEGITTETTLFRSPQDVLGG